MTVAPSQMLNHSIELHDHVNSFNAPSNLNIQQFVNDRSVQDYSGVAACKLITTIVQNLILYVIIMKHSCVIFKVLLNWIMLVCITSILLYLRHLKMMHQNISFLYGNNIGSILHCDAVTRSQSPATGILQSKELTVVDNEHIGDDAAD